MTILIETITFVLNYTIIMLYSHLLSIMRVHYNKYIVQDAFGEIILTFLKTLMLPGEVCK